MFQISDVSSVRDDLTDMTRLPVLQSTASMIPLVNVKSLTQNFPNVDTTLMTSVLSFVGAYGRTPSMKVLRSVSEIEKEFEMVLVQNTGVVTDKNKTEELQTDIVYKDFRDDELD